MAWGDLTAEGFLTETSEDSEGFFGGITCLGVLVLAEAVSTEGRRLVGEDEAQLLAFGSVALATTLAIEPFATSRCGGGVFGGVGDKALASWAGGLEPSVRARALASWARGMEPSSLARSGG